MNKIMILACIKVVTRLCCFDFPAVTSICCIRCSYVVKLLDHASSTFDLITK